MGGNVVQRPWTPTKRRGPIAAEFTSPGPAAVGLASFIGHKAPTSGKNSAPAFSFGNRYGDRNATEGPGPGQYNVAGLSSKGKDCPIASSLHGRPKDPKAFQTPAPGTYDPDCGDKVVLDNAPAYSFGVKTQNGKPDNNPAPNSYNMPPVLGWCAEGGKKAAPAYSLSGRAKDMGPRSVSPGPGAYEPPVADAYKLRSPSYSLSTRTVLPSDDTLKPGPGAHSPEKVRMDSVPSHSFGIKHSPYSSCLKNEMW